MNDTYTATSPVAVTISSKKTSFSSCPNNNCQFTYKAETAALDITHSSPANTTGGSYVSLYGTNLNIHSGCSAALQSKIDNLFTFVNPSSCTSTRVRFKVPKTLVNGGYYLYQKSDSGFSNPISFAVKWKPGTIFQ